MWAPRAKRVEVHLFTHAERWVDMEPRPGGYFEAVVRGAPPGTLYRYRLDGDKERPDPASRSQPQGVHGPSEVIDTSYQWHDERWQGLPLRDYVIYELHVGTFTAEGTFDAVIAHLDELKRLGVTALELMPVAQFAGSRNWGYDGVYPYAVQNSYGGPQGLKRLVDACHGLGLAVVLDVVYNHLGPEGNYLWDYGPYFTEDYRTPWGAAVNFDGAHSDEVRRFFVENALTWLEEYHIDALRLDAVHAIKDFSARTFLGDLSEATAELKARLHRRLYLFAESDLNDARMVAPLSQGGQGMDAQWSDDFHHAVHTLLTGEKDGYYADFGRLEHLARAYRDAFAYTGQVSPARKRRHGNSARERKAEQFIVCAQNHDQVGNRALGERLGGLVPFEGLKLAAATMLLSPYVPLLFMGEEYGEPAPFLYFASHGDPALVENVREGRKREFAEFHFADSVPDPQAEATFERSRLRQELRRAGHHRLLADFYQRLLELRRTVPALARLDKDDMQVLGYEKTRALFVRRWTKTDEVFFVLHFTGAASSVTLPVPAGAWQLVLDSADARWGGPGGALPRSIRSDGEVALGLAPLSVALYQISEAR